MVKASSDLLAALRVDKESDFSAGLLAYMTAQSDLNASLQKQVTELSEANTKLTTASTEATETISTLAGKVEAIDVDAVVQKATKAGEDAGSLAAATAMGRANLQAIQPAPAADDVPITEAAKVADHLAAGNYEEAFKLDKDAHRDFPDAQSYAAYHRAFSEGRVKIQSK